MLLTTNVSSLTHKEEKETQDANEPGYGGGMVTCINSMKQKTQKSPGITGLCVCDRLINFMLCRKFFS